MYKKILFLNIHFGEWIVSTSEPFHSSQIKNLSFYIVIRPTSGDERLVFV